MFIQTTAFGSLQVRHSNEGPPHVGKCSDIVNIRYMELMEYMIMHCRHQGAFNLPKYVCIMIDMGAIKEISESAG